MRAQANGRRQMKNARIGKWALADLLGACLRIGERARVCLRAMCTWVGCIGVGGTVPAAQDDGAERHIHEQNRTLEDHMKRHRDMIVVDHRRQNGRQPRHEHTACTHTHTHTERKRECTVRAWYEWRMGT
jgi:hypothetical protein